MAVAMTRTRARARSRFAPGVALLVLLGLLGLPTPASAALVGSISGVVTAGGEPLANVWVSAVPVTPTGDWAGRGFVTSTDARGQYRFPDVYVPHVKVQARAPALSGLASTYWPRAFSFAAAEVLGVASSGSIADIELAPGGSVSGAVVAESSGAPVPGARVSAYLADDLGSEPVGSPGLTQGPGRFVIDGLPPVPVVLYAAAPPTGNLLGRWFDDADFAGAATALDGGSAATGLRIPLAEGGEVTGTVRDDTGRPVAGARVTLTRCPGLCPLVASTDERGDFRIGSIPAGRGLMVHVSAADQGLLEEWYRRPGDRREARLDLAPGGSRAGLDVVLSRGAFLSASIVDADSGAAVPGVSAELQSSSDPLLGYLPGTRDRLLVRGGSPMLSSTGAGEDPERDPRDAEPGPDPRPGANGQRGRAGPGAAAGGFVIGPVPPGEYRLVLYPGYDNRRYVPVVWGSPTGIDRTGVIRLRAGEQAQVVVPLVPARGDRGADGCASDPTGRWPSGCRGDQRAAAGGSTAAPDPAAPAWPGLPAGFLQPAAPWGVPAD
jgi:hypothetical protein